METLLQYGLAAVFVALLLTPFGLVIPEEISLLAAGALAKAGHAPYWASLLVGYSGIILADTITWGMGRAMGLRPTGWIARLIGTRQIDRIDRFYRRYGTWTIAICRMFPGMRLPAFFFAGATGISYRRFLRYDGSAALITANLYVYLGLAFADNLGRVVAWLNTFREGIAIVVGAVVVILIVRALILRFRPKEP